MKDDRITDPFYLLVQQEINRIDRKENIFKWFYYIFRTTQVLLTGTITVIAANKETLFCCSFNVSITLLGAIVTALTALETLFLLGFKKNTYKELLFELREIRAELIFIIYTSGQSIDIARISAGDIRPIFEKYKQAKGLLRGLNDRATADLNKNQNNTPNNNDGVNNAKQDDDTTGQNPTPQP
ncbi:hypothetical protein ACLI1A_07340 [Flavobacterium sp. RHBU_3]|uniref:hypothetical protein n=1 Tax=Flavobacterium sp. RHBU_3 TaxID=3391184 RepID=UPI0039856B50